MGPPSQPAAGQAAVVQASFNRVRVKLVLRAAVARYRGPLAVRLI